MIATEEGAFNPREELREMPELAEVIYFRKLWEAALNRRVRGVDLNPRARIFRGMVPGAIRDGLRGRDCPKVSFCKLPCDRKRDRVHAWWSIWGTMAGLHSIRQLGRRIRLGQLRDEPGD